MKFNEFPKEKQKQLLLAGGVAVLLVIIYFSVLFGAMANTARMEKKVPVKVKEYKEMVQLSNDFAVIKSTKLTNIKTPPLAYLENKINELDLSESLVSIRPLADNNKDIEIKLESLSGGAVIKLIYEIQKLPFTVKQLSLKDYEHDGIWTLMIILGTNT
ncbi:MAG: type II secretion system protein GspM [Armatimonadota bacterium]